jgi:hypothetical protein
MENYSISSNSFENNVQIHQENNYYASGSSRLSHSYIYLDGDISLILPTIQNHLKANPTLVEMRFSLQTQLLIEKRSKVQKAEGLQVPANGSETMKPTDPGLMARCNVSGLLAAPARGKQCSQSS